jgi:hypothetical protein
MGTRCPKVLITHRGPEWTLLEADFIIPKERNETLENEVEVLLSLHPRASWLSWLGACEDSVDSSGLGSVATENEQCGSIALHRSGSRWRTQVLAAVSVVWSEPMGDTEGPNHELQGYMPNCDETLYSLNLEEALSPALGQDRDVKLRF